MSLRKPGRILWLLTLSVAYGAESRLSFKQPNEASAALLAALESRDYSGFLMIAGPQMASFWSSGDAERDSIEREHLLEAARRCGFKVAAPSADRRDVYFGDVPQPFPAPLVRTESGWQFDEDAGAQEMAARRIRRDEIAVVELCRHFRDAEFAYLALLPDGEPSFAHKIRSSPGKHDGLFWSGGSQDDESPLGPAFAAAVFAERGPAESPKPLFGYYYKILVAQGPDAQGGSLDYRANGRLRKGFALIAWPAQYGVDGFRSFLVNHFGDVYRKDLGPDTARIAEGTSIFNPDRTWTKVNDDD